MASRGITAAIFVALWVLVLPSAAHAQSTIAGVVKDASGAVLPGVTVEASSDVLIERARSVITDAAGQYKIVDLRPGVYVVTFTLAGFQTFRRDGLELPSSFTATVNADLRVGGLEETLTVTGESPIVDVQSTVHTQVLSRDLLDAVPTGRTIQGVGQLVVGINLNIPDVGGSRAMTTTQAALMTRGVSQLYVSLGDPNPGGATVVRVYHKPLVLLIWLGAGVMALGGALSLSDRRLRVGVPKPARARAASRTISPSGSRIPSFTRSRRKSRPSQSRR